MSEFSDYLENKLINITLRGGTTEGAAFNVTQAYLALYITDPTDLGSGTECNWAGYIRQKIDFSAPVGGVARNSKDIQFPPVAGAAVTISHAAILDAVTLGNLLYHTNLGSSKTFDIADIAMWGPNSLTVTLL